MCKSEYEVDFEQALEWEQYLPAETEIADKLVALHDSDDKRQSSQSFAFRGTRR